MNILIDLLPITIEINGMKYDINSDFRTSILFELLMQDSELEDNDKIIQALKLFYPVIPGEIDKAIEHMLWFYRCGKDIVLSSSSGKGKSVTSVYSFDYDDDYIYAAFLDQYKVDLQDIEYLHWWKFKAMFKALKEDNEMVKIMGYRSMDLSKIKDKEEKAHYKKMKELFKIPVKVSRNEQQKISDIEKALLGNGDISDVL